MWVSTVFAILGPNVKLFGGLQKTAKVFQWGAGKISASYDSHSWGVSEGSTVSNRFITKFFRDAVIPKFGCSYEVLTVFIQHSDEFVGISPEFLASLCRGRAMCALYFLWPIQGHQSYGEKLPTAAGYVSAEPFYQLVSRMEACGIPTCWPHPVQLWKVLTSKDWISQLCTSPQFQISLTTRVSKAGAGERGLGCMAAADGFAM